jgi:hypothetical protein
MAPTYGSNMLNERARVKAQGEEPPSPFSSQNFMGRLMATAIQSRMNKQIAKKSIIEEYTKVCTAKESYKRYFKYTSKASFVGLLILFIFSSFLIISIDIFVAFWAADAIHIDSNTFMLIYAGGAIVGSFLVALRDYFFFKTLRHNVSVLHKKAMESILNFRLSSFVHTPASRIYFRMTKD